MKIWPFLITRNKTLGYQVVVAPDFLVEAHMTSVLLYVTEGDLLETSEAYARQIIDEQHSQTVTVIYQIRNAKNDRGEVRKDGFGRTVTETIGLVLPEKLSSSVIPTHILDQLSQTLEESIQQFWLAETHFPVLKASALEWPLQIDDTACYTLINLSPYQISESKSAEPSKSSTKIETNDARNSQQNMLLRLFVSFWNWLTNKQ
jgi:hypothetical protein